MAEEPESVISAGGEPALTDEEVLGFDPAKAAPVKDTRKAAATPGAPEETSAGSPSAPSTAGEAAPAGTPAAETGEIAAGTTQSEKFSFFGRDFDSREAAENYFRTWEGQLSAAHRKFSELTEQMARQNELIERYQREGASKPPEKPAPAPEGPKKLADLVDWEVYKELAENKGVDFAQEWLALKWEEALEAREKALTEKLEDKFGSKFAVTEKLQEYTEKLQLAGGLFEKMSLYVNDDGSPAYPEMSDPDFIEEMAYRWDKIPNKEAMGLQGAYLAYLEARDRLSRTAKAAPVPPKTPLKPLPPTQDTTIESGPAPRTSGGAPRGTSVKQAMLEEMKRVDPVLGF